MLCRQKEMGIMRRNRRRPPKDRCISTVSVMDQIFYRILHKDTKETRRIPKKTIQDISALRQHPGFPFVPNADNIMSRMDFSGTSGLLQRPNGVEGLYKELLAQKIALARENLAQLEKEMAMSQLGLRMPVMGLANPSIGNSQSSVETLLGAQQRAVENIAHFEREMAFSRLGLRDPLLRFANTNTMENVSVSNTNTSLPSQLFSLQDKDSSAND
mmetsp:Transcript_19280/g.29294  ORF Transcript_19280/g.29294 Transcript_19280/m.29294 type:complete len:215 (+) Transcript_19280:404-1048(+)